jgi:hypothetical protein
MSPIGERHHSLGMLAYDGSKLPDSIPPTLGNDLTPLIPSS